MEEHHALVAMAYVEQNPLRTGMARTAGEYRWSSAEAHLSGADPSERLDFGAWQVEYTAARWSEVLKTSVMEEEQRQRFQEATQSGAPSGSEAYVEKLERELGKALRRRPRGRPRKPRAVAAAGSSTAPAG